MIVGEANPLVDGVHDRMPVLLMSGDHDSVPQPASMILRLCSSPKIRGLRGKQRQEKHGRVH
jgi:hypothetical protein